MQEELPEKQQVNVGTAWATCGEVSGQIKTQPSGENCTRAKALPREEKERACRTTPGAWSGREGGRKKVSGRVDDVDPVGEYVGKSARRGGRKEGEDGSGRVDDDVEPGAWPPLDREVSGRGM